MLREKKRTCVGEAEGLVIAAVRAFVIVTMGVTDPVATFCVSLMHCRPGMGQRSSS